MEVNNSNSFCVDMNQVFKAQSVSLPIDNDCIQTLINFLPKKDVTAFSLVCMNAKVNADIVILKRAKEAGFDSEDAFKANFYLRKLYAQVEELCRTESLEENDWGSRQRFEVVVPVACIQYDSGNKMDPEKTLEKLQNLSIEDLLFIYSKERFYSSRYDLAKVFIDVHEKRRPAQPQLNEEVLKFVENDARQAYYEGISSEILVNRGVNFININAKFKFSGAKTLLHQAAAKGDLFFAEFLLKNNADVNCLDFFSTNPLFHAKSVEVAKLLLEKGARADLVSSNGFTCLHHAESVEVAKLLLDNGAKIDAISKNGDTALDMAKLMFDNRHKQSQDLIDFLESYQNNK